MPVYEYACDKCGKVTEAMRPMRDADAKIDCEHCGSKKTKRAHSVFMTSGTDSDSASGPKSGRASGGHNPGCACCSQSRSCPMQ